MEPWIDFVSIGLIALAAGFVHSAIGFGFGIVAISLIPIVMDVRTAHVVVSISSVPIVSMRALTTVSEKRHSCPRNRTHLRTLCALRGQREAGDGFAAGLSTIEAGAVARAGHSDMQACERW